MAYGSRTTIREFIHLETLAADVIGFYDKNNGGELGLEKKYDSDLTGTDGLAYTYVDDSSGAYRGS